MAADALSSSPLSPMAVGSPGGGAVASPLVCVVAVGSPGGGAVASLPVSPVAGGSPGVGAVPSPSDGGSMLQLPSVEGIPSPMACSDGSPGGVTAAGGAWDELTQEAPPSSSRLGAEVARSGGPAAPVLGDGFMSKPTMEEIVAFGGIADPSRSGVRSSARLRAMPDADRPQLERAMDLAERRDSAFQSGTRLCSKLSFVSIPNEVIVERASKLGVSFGASPLQVSDSIKNLKEIEEARNITFLKNTLSTDEGEGLQSLVVRKASNLCDDLDDEVEEGLGDQVDLLVQGVKVNRSRMRKVVKRVQVRRSDRLQKQNRTSS